MVLEGTNNLPSGNNAVYPTAAIGNGMASCVLTNGLLYKSSHPLINSRWLNMSIEHTISNQTLAPYHTVDGCLHHDSWPKIDHGV